MYMSSPRIFVPLVIALSMGMTLVSGATAFAAYSPATPTATGGAMLTSGSDLADNAGTTSAEIFGTNQSVASPIGYSNTLWWAIALAGLGIIGIAWLGYRELV
jgi:hypothetical protein